MVQITKKNLCLCSLSKFPWKQAVRDVLAWAEVTANINHTLYTVFAVVFNLSLHTKYTSIITQIKINKICESATGVLFFLNFFYWFFQFKIKKGNTAKHHNRELLVFFCHLLKKMNILFIILTHVSSLFYVLHLCFELTCEVYEMRGKQLPQTQQTQQICESAPFIMR